MIVPVPINKEWTPGARNRTSEVPGRHQNLPPRAAGLTPLGWAGVPKGPDLGQNVGFWTCPGIRPSFAVLLWLGVRAENTRALNKNSPPAQQV